MTQCLCQLTRLADPLKREAGCKPLPSYCHNPVASIQHNMYYSVQVKRNPFDGHDYTLIEAYFQGCDRHYMAKEEAEEYLASFEDWEQDLLVIDEYPF
jgi:hypothetical protein